MAVYIFYGAILARSLAIDSIPSRLFTYISLELVFLILFTLVLWRPRLPSIFLQLYYLVQVGIALLLISMCPDFDFVINLFVLLSYQAGLVFPDPTRWVWVGVLFFLTGGPITYYLGVEGLTKALLAMVGCIIFAAYVVTNQEVETARGQSQAMLKDLQEKHQQLEEHASQAEELAVIEERNRLARELHDSVSQTMFSIVLTIRSAQILLERDPSRLRSQLEQLRELTQNALGQMRSLIAQLRFPDLHPKS